MSHMDRMRDYGFVPANHSTPNYFPVGLVDLRTPDGVTVPGWKAVQRQDTLQVLAVHTDAYRLVSHEAVTAAFDQAVESLDTTGMMVGSDLTHNGGRLFRQYVLPAYQIETGKGDASALRIVAFNSYDGSAAINFRAGTYRFVCANTAVVGTDIAAVRRRHTAGLMVDDIADGMAEACALYSLQMERMRRWVGVGVTTTDAIRMIESLPGSNDALIGAMTMQWIAAEEAHGPSLWTLYNCFTAWATHTPTKGGNAFATRIGREDRVARLVETKEWKVLETVS
jgi:hypothetical protein